MSIYIGVAVALFVAVVVFFLALCRAAALADDAIQQAKGMR
jgi:hypothetical protein